jgi:hypothetical protein
MGRFYKASEAGATTMGVRARQDRRLVRIAGPDGTRWRTRLGCAYSLDTRTFSEDETLRARRD